MVLESDAAEIMAMRANRATKRVKYFILEGVDDPGEEE